MNKKLQKNLVKLMTNDKVEFFAGNIINREFIKEDNLTMKTMATDGIKIYYSDDWIDNLSDEEIQFSIVHEFLHIIFMHPNAVAELNLNREVANIAQDIVINAILQHDSIGNHPQGVITASWDGSVTITINDIEFKFENAHTKNFLEIYKEIMSKAPPSKGGYTLSQGGNKKTPMDEVIPNKLSEEQKEDINGEINQMNANAKMRGSDSSFARSLDKLTKGVVPWKNYIRPVIDRATAGFPTYSRPRRRNGNGQIIFPSIKRIGVNVTVAIDTSGSISDKELSYFLGEIDNLLSSYPKGSVTVNALYHTTNVYSIAKSAKYIKDVVSKVESGGTSHLDVFNKAEELNSKILICLTDGYSEYPETTNIPNVIFILTDKNGDVPDFAKKIDVSEVYKHG